MGTLDSGARKIYSRLNLKFKQGSAFFVTKIKNE